MMQHHGVRPCSGPVASSIIVGRCSNVRSSTLLARSLLLASHQSACACTRAPAARRPQLLGSLARDCLARAPADRPGSSTLLARIALIKEAQRLLPQAGASPSSSPLLLAAVDAAAPEGGGAAEVEVRRRQAADVAQAGRGRGADGELDEGQPPAAPP